MVSRMAIIVQCPQCGQRYQLRDDLAGKQAKCKCGNVLPVPAAPSPADAGLSCLLQQDAPSTPPLSQQPPTQGAGGGFVAPQFQGFPGAQQTAPSNTKLWLWLAIGGGGAVLLILIAVIVKLL